MTEVLGFTARIISLIQLTGKVISVGYGYMGGVKRATKDLQGFIDELSSLSRVLISLQDYVEGNLQSVVFRGLSDDGGPIKECVRELEELWSRLGLRDGWRGVVDNLVWPLKEKEMVQYVGRIERYKGMFVLALATDQALLSREIGMNAVVHVIQKGLEMESRVQKAWRGGEDDLRIGEEYSFIFSRVFSACSLGSSMASY